MRRSAREADPVTTEAGARPDGLGEPDRLETNPTIGGVPTPSRPVFGRAYLRTTTPEAYHRTREGVGPGIEVAY